MSLITPALIAALQRQFRLDWHGIHGAPHWARVRANGLQLAPLTGANAKVVEYFAFLHDACREHDDYDTLHGRKAGELVYALRDLIRLEASEREELATACELHSDGHTCGFSVTVLTCWDADRLDLARVGITPHPSRLCTEAACDPAMIELAVERSRQWRRGR